MARSETAAAIEPAKAAEPRIDEQVRRIRKDISDLAGTVGAAGSATARELKRSAANKTGEIADITSETIADLRAQLADVERKLEDKVRERPLAALGIAAAAGFLVAMLARR